MLSATPIASTAPSLFVGRRPMLRRLEDHVLLPRAPGSYAVLALTAIGGQGKSRLLEEFAKRLDAIDRRVLRLDFDVADQRDSISGPLHLRQQMVGLGYATYAFDAAYAKLFAALRPGRDIRADHPELFAIGLPMGEDVLGLAWDILSEMPGGGIAAKLAKRLASTGRDWWRARGNALIAGLDEMGVQEIRDELPYFLGAELRSAPGPLPCLLVDTFEAAVRDEISTEAGSASAAAVWLRRLIAEAPSMPVLMAGRCAPEWAEHDPAWAGVITTIGLDQLDPPAVDEWLDAAAVDDAPVRRRIHKVAKGHPLTLRLLTRIHDGLIAGGRKPTPDDFPGRPREVLDRALRHLDPAHRAIVKVLAVANRVDRAMWESLASSGLHVFDLKAPDEVLDDVLFIRLDDESFALHELVREQLVLTLSDREPELLRRARLAVFGHLDNILRHRNTLAEREVALPEAASLLLAADPGRYAAWMSELHAEALSTESQRQYGSRHLPALVERAFAMERLPAAEDALQLAGLLSRLDPWSKTLQTLLDLWIPEIDAGTEKLEQATTLVGLAIRHARFVSAEPARRLHRRLQANHLPVLEPGAELQLRDVCGDYSFARLPEILADKWVVTPELCRYLAHGSDPKRLDRVGDAVRDLFDNGENDAVSSAMVLLDLVIGLRVEHAVGAMTVLCRRAFMVDNDIDLKGRLEYCAIHPLIAKELAMMLARAKLVEGDVSAAACFVGESVPLLAVNPLIAYLRVASWLDGLSNDVTELTATRRNDVEGALGLKVRLGEELLCARSVYHETLENAGVADRLERLIRFFIGSRLPATPWSRDLLRKYVQETSQARRQSSDSTSDPEQAVALCPEIGGDGGFRVELAINDRSECIIFYNRPDFSWCSMVEVILLDSSHMLFMSEYYGARNFGVSIRPELGRYLVSGTKVLQVLMDDASGEPIVGDYFPLLVMP